MPVTLLLALALHHGPVVADTSIRLARGSAVEINGSDGAITIRVGADDMLIVRGGRVHGRATVQVEGNDPSQPRDGNLEVTIPAWARLDVSSDNGDLTFIGTPARLHAETVNGQITVKGGSGTASLESVNGNFNVTDFHGEKMSIDATSGDITVTGGTGSFGVESVNGAIHLRDMRATDVQASSVNEVVEYSGTLDPRGTYDIESHNGGINLWLPADVSARMKISTFNGEFTSPDIPATTNGSRDAARSDVGNDKGAKGSKGSKGSKASDGGAQEFTVTFGKGDASVSLDSFNGNITVRRLRPRQP